MSSLEDVYEEGGRWRAVAREAVLFAGSLVAAVGFVAAAASLIAGFGFGMAEALAVAALLGGALLLAGFLVRAARTADGETGSSLMLAGVGTVTGLAGLALFWTTLPTDWTGNLVRLPELALGTYAVGLVLVFWNGRGVAASATDREARTDDSDSETPTEGPDSLGGLGTSLGANAGETQLERASGSSAVGDGGEEDGDLEFFDDSES